MDTPALRAQGLSGRQGLPRGRGMLFVFDRAERHAFWMKDMHFDIDIIWITGGEIVDLVHARAPSPGAPPPTYTPDSAAEYVLEVVAGTAAERGWAKGSPVGIEWLGERP